MPYLNKIVTEVCVETFDVAVAAENTGVTRIELCSALALGGLTPPNSLIQKVCQTLKIPVNVMVRPRAGDFLYSKNDFELMLHDVEHAKTGGASGIVFGILNEDGHVDVKRCKQIIDVAGPMHVTFHRAFDMTSDPFLALEEIVSLGIDTILTSGKRQVAEVGLELIRELAKRANDRISIMAGSGVNSQNILLLYEAGVKAFHFSAQKKVQSKMRFVNDSLLSMGNSDNEGEYSVPEFDEKKLASILATIKSF
jgi:copper homeostasis protein